MYNVCHNNQPGGSFSLSDPHLSFIVSFVAERLAFLCLAPLNDLQNMNVGICGQAVPHVAWCEWDRQGHRSPYVYDWRKLGCMEDVISPHQHQANRIEGTWENGKEVDVERRPGCRTQRVRKAEVKVTGPNKWTNSCQMETAVSLVRARITVAGTEIPL